MAITIMMKIVKKGPIHPLIFIALFNFLNKALFSLPASPDLVNGHVADYALKRFFKPDRGLEVEGRFQFLFFVINIMVIQRIKIDFSEFLAYVESFEFVNLRFASAVMNSFDAFLVLALWSKDNPALIFKKKMDYFHIILQKMNSGAIAYSEQNSVN